jgi:hypothetical protein
MSFDPTLPPPLDLPLANGGASVSVPIEPPPVVAPKPARTAGTPPPPPVAVNGELLLKRPPRERVSLFRRGWNYVRATLQQALHDPTPHQHHRPRTPMERIIGGTPPWLVSLFIHAALIVILGLLAVEVHRQVTEELTVAMAPDEDVSNETFAETLGNQLETPNTTPPDQPTNSSDPGYSLSSLPEVANPLSAPLKTADLMADADGPGLFSEIQAPSIGNMLKGRQEGQKKLLLDIYGGTMTTQHAVDLSLAWLSRQQGKDGLWSLKGPYPDGSSTENKVSATSMALLAFLGDGHTHLSPGPYRQTVARGIRALMKLQGSEGQIVPDGGSATHLMYSHAQATIVLCELYAMSQDSEIREAAELAVKYCLETQSPKGGWRYYPHQDADTSVTGWFVMALQSARMAKLKVPSEDLIRIGQFLDSASSHEGSRYGYQPGRGETPPMTAEALLCRQYLGWRHDDKRLLAGVAYVGKHPVDWKKRNVYYWYYATQLMHHMGGKPWIQWNKVMRQVVPENQVHTGKQHGSWDPEEDQWGHIGGRLFTTCLSTYMLEVYYRHLPLYSQGATAGESEGEAVNPPAETKPSKKEKSADAKPEGEQP